MNQGAPNWQTGALEPLTDKQETLRAPNWQPGRPEPTNMGPRAAN